METTHSERPSHSTFLVLLGLPLSLFLYELYLTLLPQYGYFIDEVYYIACAKRLAWGYVDHPPLSIFLLAAERWVLGDSLTALRFLPAVAAAVNVLMTGLLVRQLGGGILATVVALIGAMAMPVYLLMGSFYSMNAFEPVILTVIVYSIIRLEKDEQPQWWLFVGLLTGLGLEMKHTMVVYMVALGVGLLLTPARRFLWNRWFLGGMIIAVIVLIPNLLWQYTHGFPSIEFYRNAMVSKNVPTPPHQVMLMQILFANPFAFPVWIAGVVFAFSRAGSRFRYIGWTYLVLIGVMVASQSSRPDRIAAIYAALFAMGGVALERLGKPGLRRAVISLLSVASICGSVIMAPVVTPLLPPIQLRGYLSAIGFSYNIEKGKMNEPLPQWIADRLGWKELAVDVAQVYHLLSPEDQKNAVIVCKNYGEAGALELYGPEFGLPPVFATHNNYLLWGPPSDSVGVFIAVGVSRKDLDAIFEDVVEASVHTCADCTRPQQRVPIDIARKPRGSIEKEWLKFKTFG
jgi:4-amino-4-deoxy-L-arabinose transferase-like glycosyltransferase